MPWKSQAGRSCLLVIAIILLAVLAALAIYSLISRMGSAQIVIDSLSVGEKSDKNGNIIPGSQVIRLKLRNDGRQPARFCPDRKNYLEAQKLEGAKPKPIWSFTTELFFPDHEDWIEYDNRDLWIGSKITPGALEITIEKGDTLELEFYLKSPRGLRINPPVGRATDLDPQKIRIIVIAPTGKTSDSREIDL